MKLCHKCCLACNKYRTAKAQKKCKSQQRRAKAIRHEIYVARKKEKIDFKRLMEDNNGVDESKCK